MSSPIETEATGAMNTHEYDDPKKWKHCDWCDSPIYYGEDAFEHDDNYFDSFDCMEKMIMADINYRRLSAGENDE